MRRGEDFLGRDIGVAGDAVLGGGGAAFPFMAVGEPDREIGARPGIMQRVEALAVQPFGPLAQHGIVLLPRSDGVIIVDARGREDRVRQVWPPRHRPRRRGKPASPMTGGIGDDVPVDVEIDDPFQRRLVGDRIGLAGARDLGGILPRQQHRIVADDGEPGAIGGKRLRHALVEPAGGAIETVVVPETIARQGDLFVRQKRRDETGAGLVGMLGDFSHQRQRRRRRRHQQILSRLELQPNFDGDFGETVEFDGIDRCRDVALVDGHEIRPVAGGVAMSALSHDGPRSPPIW